MPIRPSQLNIAQHCDLAPYLQRKYPTTSANIERGILVDREVSRALTSDYQPDDPDAVACVKWLRANVVVQEVQQRIDLRTAAGRLITGGTPDVVGVDTWDPRCLVIVDLKKREQILYGHLPPIDDNLQLHAYALAHLFTKPEGYRAYRLCILFFGDGKAGQMWSDEYTRVSSLPILGRIQEICARETPEGGMVPLGKAGPHCTDCYQRIHCRHWTLPAHEGPSALAPFIAPGGLTTETAGKALMVLKAMKETVELAEERLKAFHLANGPGSVRVGDKSWEPVAMPGRRTANVRALEAAGLHEYVTEGPGYERWILRRRSGSE